MRKALTAPSIRVGEASAPLMRAVWRGLEATRRDQLNQPSASGHVQSNWSIYARARMAEFPMASSIRARSFRDCAIGRVGKREISLIRAQAVRISLVRDPTVFQQSYSFRICDRTVTLGSRRGGSLKCGVASIHWECRMRFCFSPCMMAYQQRREWLRGAEAGREDRTRRAQRRNAV